MVNGTFSRNIKMPEPEISGLLPDVPGGQPNLIPVTLTHDDLKVWFTIPAHSDPSLERETVELFVDYADDKSIPISEREWTAPIQDSDRYVWLPSTWLRNVSNEGQHRLSYRVTVYNGEQEFSEELEISLDITAPVLANGNDNELSFPPDILPPGNKLTARYLERNGDAVRAGVPRYEIASPWDRITWYWGTSPGDFREGGVIELDDKNYTNPIVITVVGQLIRDRGDGKRYVTYVVRDRAGNTTPSAVSVELDVAATPIPRTLPWPLVERAAGEGEQQTVDPLQATAGVVVKVPDEAVIYPGEKVWVQWGEPGSLGSRRVEQPIIPGQRRFQVDMPAVAAHIGKTLSVDYGVIDEFDEEHPSTRRKLQVTTIPSNRFETVKCDGLSGGNLSYKAVAAEGARLTLAKWSLITTDQWILITMTGVGSSGQDSVYEAVKKRAVTDQEVIGGIGQRTEIRVPKAFLNTLRRNASLTGKVYVSFDGGLTWPPVAAPNFPLLQLTFID
ncbi:hypothetical protein [Pseudomonas sp. GM55]|uniref:hypothetical protein n=1 Tax=Pseudomonas sp. GM55 TaxID=1144333 RepID=UPI00027067CE|nr:hypothetical protein [Pseudomonas sp. GM55]EJM69723.1 hypothetical protein PMI31_04608 [Pseudomonas sp. GM55]